jgi:hypothetical protein
MQSDGERWVCKVCRKKHNKARWQKFVAERGPITPKKGHRWTSEEAKVAGKKGGQS